MGRCVEASSEIEASLRRTGQFVPLRFSSMAPFWDSSPFSVKAKEAKEAFSAKQQQIERLKQHAFLEAWLTFAEIFGVDSLLNLVFVDCMICMMVMMQKGQHAFASLFVPLLLAGNMWLCQTALSPIGLKSLSSLRLERKNVACHCDEIQVQGTIGNYLSIFEHVWANWKLQPTWTERPKMKALKCIYLAHHQWEVAKSYAQPVVSSPDSHEREHTKQATNGGFL